MGIEDMVNKAKEALGGDAKVMGMSKRRLPEFMEAEASAWKRIVLVGLSDPARPEAEDDLIARLRDALDAHRAAHPSAAQQLADELGQWLERPQAGRVLPL